MKISFACLLLFTILLCRGTHGNERYDKFINQHIKADMTADACDKVITQRSISKTDSNECKETNTFIQTSTSYVKPVCADAGEPYDEQLRKSTKPFPVVVCKLKNEEARLPRCQYRGQSRTSYIVIACEDGLPVHFAEDIVLVGN